MSPPVSPPSDLPPVLIVMCTYNGARWLPAQLASLAAQDHTDWTLVVSDDGSQDSTCDILREFAQDHPVILHQRQGAETGDLAPSQRAARNYMQTLLSPDLPWTPQTYVALSDQDDIWRPDKLSHALTVLKTATRDAALYGGQSRHITADGQPIAHSRAPRRSAGLHNALVQNVVSGHSAVMNPEAMATLRRFGLPDRIWYHDWWIYLLLTATGAQALVDDHEGLDYRQHDTNVMGAGQGWAARLLRLRQILNGEYGQWLQANLTALSKRNDALTLEAQTALSALNTDKRTIGALWRSKAYRQRTVDTLGLYLAALLRRL